MLQFTSCPLSMKCCLRPWLASRHLCCGCRVICLAHVRYRAHRHTHRHAHGARCVTNITHVCHVCSCEFVWMSNTWRRRCACQISCAVVGACTDARNGIISAFRSVGVLRGVFGTPQTCSHDRARNDTQYSRVCRRWTHKRTH